MHRKRILGPLGGRLAPSVGIVLERMNLGILLFGQLVVFGSDASFQVGANAGTIVFEETLDLRLGMLASYGR